MSEANCITSMTADPKAPDLRRIRVGPARIATIRRQDADSLGLAIGDELTDSLRHTLRQLDTLASLRLRAIRSLSRAAASRRRLSHRLRTHGTPTDIDEVLDQLVQEGLLDDHAAARQLAEEAVRREPLGRRRLEAILYSRGFERADIDVAVEHALADRDPRADVLEAAHRAARSLQHLPYDTAARRLTGRLARRGFDHESIRHAIEVCLQAE
jgi:regulatory protein